MRFLFGLIGLLITMALVLYLASRQTQTTHRTLQRAVPGLREDVAPAEFDGARARELTTELYGLLEVRALPGERLVEIASLCASWAAGSQPGGSAYRVAIKLRGAADELLAEAQAPGGRHRDNARRLILEAQQTLAGEAGSLPGPVGGIRDQLENLQRSQQERAREVEQELR